MSKKMSPKRRRARKAGKRVLVAADQPGADRRVAIEVAVEFLKAAIAQERFALAAVEREDDRIAGDGHTERIVAGEIEALATIEQIRRFKNDEPIRAREYEAAISARVDLMVGTLVRSVPREVRAEREELEFQALYRSIEGIVTSPVPFPFDTSKTDDVKRYRRWEEDLDAARREHSKMLERREQLTQMAIEALASDRIVEVRAACADEWRVVQERLKETQQRLQQLDPRTPVFGSMTRVREEVAKRLGISKNTAIALAKKTGLTATKATRSK